MTSTFKSEVHERLRLHDEVVKKLGNEISEKESGILKFLKVAPYQGIPEGLGIAVKHLDAEFERMDRIINRYVGNMETKGYLNTGEVEMLANSRTTLLKKIEAVKRVLLDDH